MPFRKSGNAADVPHLHTYKPALSTTVEDAVNYHSLASYAVTVQHRSTTAIQAPESAF